MTVLSTQNRRRLPVPLGCLGNNHKHESTGCRQGEPGPGATEPGSNSCSAPCKMCDLAGFLASVWHLDRSRSTEMLGEFPPSPHFQRELTVPLFWTTQTQGHFLLVVGDIRRPLPLTPSIKPTLPALILLVLHPNEQHLGKDQIQAQSRQVQDNMVSCLAQCQEVCSFNTVAWAMVPASSLRPVWTCWNSSSVPCLSLLPRVPAVQASFSHPPSLSATLPTRPLLSTPTSTPPQPPSLPFPPFPTPILHPHLQPSIPTSTPPHPTPNPRI